MPNGKQGDHPLTDILHHRLEVYSAEADSLIKAVVKLADEKTYRELSNRLNREYNPYMHPDVTKLVRELVELRDKLAQEARQRGFELDTD